MAFGLGFVTGGLLSALATANSKSILSASAALATKTRVEVTGKLRAILAFAKSKL